MVTLSQADKQHIGTPKISKLPLTEYIHIAILTLSVT